jgi:hypothetical protein
VSATATAKSKSSKEPAATEAEMLDLLERSLAKPGNGGAGEYGFMRHVRNDSGFNANRTFDGVSVGLWPSRGHDIHVYEVKVSRSDWKKELAKPDKAEDAAKIADRFSVVAPRGVVELSEVPATWGYIEASGGVEESEDMDGMTVRRVVGRKLRTVRAAPLLRDPKDCRGPIPRGLLVCMLRAAGAVPDPLPASQRQIDLAVYKAIQEERERVRRQAEQEQARADKNLATLQAFASAAGFHAAWSDPQRARDEGLKYLAALQSAANPVNVAKRLEHVVAEAERFTQYARNSLAELQKQKGE